MFLKYNDFQSIKDIVVINVYVLLYRAMAYSECFKKTIDSKTKIKMFVS